MFDPAICTPTRIAVWFAHFGDAHYRSVYRAQVAQCDTERSDVIEALCATLTRQDGRSDIGPRLSDRARRRGDRGRGRGHRGSEGPDRGRQKRHRDRGG
jgi:hypothetical protein